MYYITMMNEFYEHPPMPQGAEEGILKGMYCLMPEQNAQLTLLGSGTILNEVIKAQKTLKTKYNINAQVWSVTSYKELYLDAIETDRWNLLHPNGPVRKTYLQTCFEGGPKLFVAASDYVRALPCSIAKWLPGKLTALGTDGFGRSDTRTALRDYFEVDEKHIVLAALEMLAAEKRIDAAIVESAFTEMQIDPEKLGPLTV